LIAQIVYSTLAGDKVLCQATSLELKTHGLTAGLTSYSAAYATGLLVARRTLDLLKLSNVYKGTSKIDGNDYDVSANPDPNQKPFTVILDIGIRRSTVGNRVYGIMKGACDGGLNVPHSVKRFPGFQKGETKKNSKYDAAVHRDRIFGVHVDAYMEKLKEQSEDLYQKQFSQWDACLKANKVECVEDLMEKVFDSVRKNFAKTGTKKAKFTPKFLDDRHTQVQGKQVYKRDVRLNAQMRHDKVNEKVTNIRKQIKDLEDQ
jgi:large subunit ribosomal protein L5e